MTNFYFKASKNSWIFSFSGSPRAFYATLCCCMKWRNPCGFYAEKEKRRRLVRRMAALFQCFNSCLLLCSAHFSTKRYHQLHLLELSLTSELNFFCGCTHKIFNVACLPINQMPCDYFIIIFTRF